jgi:hypothetical protein
MAKDSESKPRVIKISRFQIGLNVLLQIFVLAAIVLMANYLSFRHFKRWDFSRDQKYALSSQTRNLLANLKKPVRAVIFFSSAAEIAPDVSALLREYEFASDKKFTAEVVDPFRNFTRASELQTKYKFGANENILILDYDGRSKFVNAADMAEFEQPDQVAMMAGQIQPRMTAFKGEQSITSALLEMTEGKPNKIYFTSGHGEPDIESQELKVFNEGLKRQNIQVSPLKLLDTNSIPEDARAVLICGPKYDLSELEIQLLTDYWSRKGRLFVLLNPYAKTPRLADWLAARGVRPQEDRVMRMAMFMEVDPTTNLPKGFTTRATSAAAFVVLQSGTNITRDLVDLSKELLGPTQSLLLDRTKETTAKLKIIPILGALEKSWGETDLAADESTAVYEPKSDHGSPLILAAAVEQGGVADERVKVETSRLFVAGNAEMISNNGFRKSEGITMDLAINALNWLLDREELIGIPPKEKKNVALALDERQLGQIALAVMGIIPSMAALFGFITWWQRRN